MDKKTKEKALLNLIYADENYASIAPGERPDFRVRHKYDGGEFGVEVTEFYHTESHARLDNIPDYFGEILNHGRYRHKDDLVPLAVKEIEIIRHGRDGPAEKVPGILTKLPTLEEHVSKIAEVIGGKNRRLGGYLDGLDHVNLIVVDRERRMVGAPFDAFYGHFFLPRMERVLLDSGFREVYLVAELGPFGSSRQVYLPLKMLLFVAEAFYFNAVVVAEHAEGCRKQHIDRGWALFAEYMKWRGAKGVQWRTDPEGDEVVYGNCGLLVSKEGGLIVHDYADCRLPTDLLPAGDAELACSFGERFGEAFDRHRSTHTFTIELHRDVKKSG